VQRAGEIRRRDSTAPSRTSSASEAGLSAQATLAPLTTGDYLIEITANGNGPQTRTLTAFRVIP